MPIKPRVFIGSSSESLEFAYAVQGNLENCAECTVWNQNAFALTHALFLELVRALSDYDFAIFILSPDDKLELRGATHASPRDNVIFELGAFIGAIGIERTFLITPRNVPNLHLPTDITGATSATFDSNRTDKNWSAALGPACNQIASQIGKVGRITIRRMALGKGDGVQCAAAICFRRVENQVQFLLVRSTRARRIFPKGRLKDGEDILAAATRYAHKEAGALGQPADENPKIFRYFKEEDREMQMTGAVLIEVTSQIKPRAHFRDPKWFNLKEAETQFSEGRDFEHVAELKNVLKWASDEIRQIEKPVAQGAVLPYRRTGADVEILLISSKSRKHWIVPKGNIKFAETSRKTAIREAIEEAGIEGTTSRTPIATSEYMRLGVRHTVETFAMEVKKEHQDWPEKLFREKRWVDIERAASTVDYEHLKQTIVDFKKTILGP